MTEDNVEMLFQDGFFTCALCGDETETHIVLEKNKQGHFISGFICAGPNCPKKGTYFPVINGYVE